MTRTHRCNAATAAGRLRKALSFHEAASTVMDVADDEDDVVDACITRWVHAGIAAADVLCCKRLGEYAAGENPNEAIALQRPTTRTSGASLTPRNASMSRVSEVITAAGWGADSNASATQASTTETGSSARS